MRDPRMTVRRDPLLLWAQTALLLVIGAGVVRPVVAQSTPLPPPPAGIVVVCPPTFRPSLEPWVDQRRSEELVVTVIDSQPTAAALLQSIGDASDANTRYVMLVGDAPPVGRNADPTQRVPTFYPATAITQKWGSTPTAASDLAYGDLDGDGNCDVAVGRLPITRTEQLSGLVQRILAYEHSDDFGSWRGQVQLTGGVGGFGMLVDSAIESVTRTLVTTTLPTETKTLVCYASPGHMFCPAGRSFTDEVLDRYRRGARFWVYAGHGWIDSLDRVPQSRDGVPVLDTTSVTRLAGSPAAPPIALLLACYTGAFDAPDDCLGERMLLAPFGPVAVLAGSRMTMPYGNTTTAVGLIDSIYRDQSPRLGDAWLAMQHTLYRDDETDRTSTRVVIDSLATMVSPAGTVLADERREHAAIYNLLGDPTLRLHHPQTVTLTVSTGTPAGAPMVIGFNSPIAGELTLLVDRPLGSDTGGDPNMTTVASITNLVNAGEDRQHEFRLPKDVRGPMIIRAFVSGTKAWATAAAKTIVR